MTKQICKHPATVDVKTRCFGGPVAREENRAAHGNVCVLVECCGCGARRAENRNQLHTEEGPWGPSRAERQAAASAAKRAIPAAPTGLALTDSEGRTVAADVDSEGFVWLTPRWDGGLSRAQERAIMAALPANWIERAQSVRRAVLRATEAAEAV